jgi:hypothetical protein
MNRSCAGRDKRAQESRQSTHDEPAREASLEKSVKLTPYAGAKKTEADRAVSTTKRKGV